MDIWPVVLGAAKAPPTKSPRTMIVHEYDTFQKIFAIRYLDWKLIWGRCSITAAPSWAEQFFATAWRFCLTLVGHREDWHF